MGVKVFNHLPPQVKSVFNDMKSYKLWDQRRAAETLVPRQQLSQQVSMAMNMLLFPLRLDLICTLV
jgi:hypothetical protein